MKSEKKNEERKHVGFYIYAKGNHSKRTKKEIKKKEMKRKAKKEIQLTSSRLQVETRS